MTMEQLSSQAQEVIDQYLSLKIGEKTITTPYFNNRRNQVRGGLRVLIGKGSPKDIKEEVTILSLREKADIKNLSEEDLKKYLVEHNLGVDCSGLVYHILDAELKSQNKGSLGKYIKRPWVKNPLRRLIAKFRSVENTGVSTFNNPVNSKEVDLKDIQPGDIIIMISAGPKQDYNHILIINQIADNKIQYTHSFQYPTDGLYNHGIRQETLTITNINKNLLEQNWSEPQMQEYAKKAKEFKIKRLRYLQTLKIIR